MTKYWAKMLPKNIARKQKVNRKNICSDIMERLTKEPDLLTSVIKCENSANDLVKTDDNSDGFFFEIVLIIIIIEWELGVRPQSAEEKSLEEQTEYV